MELGSGPEGVNKNEEEGDLPADPEGLRLREALVVRVSAAGVDVGLAVASCVPDGEGETLDVSVTEGELDGKLVAEGVEFEEPEVVEEEDRVEVALLALVVDRVGEGEDVP